MGKGERTLLVSGGSGRLARRVIDLLLETGRDRIVTTTRTPDRLADLAARGVDVRFADHERSETLTSAYDGVDRALIISSGVSGDRFTHVRNVVDAAAAARVSHLLYTSTLSPRPNPEDPRDNDHFWSELALFGGCDSWTILRHAMYAEHIFLSLPLGVASGRLLSVMNGMGRSYVTREDCARIDAAALAADDDECHIHNVTGPQIVTPLALAAMASRITGRAIQVVDATPDMVRDAWVAAGLPDRVARSLVRYDLDAAQGYHAVCTDAILRLTGREPESVESFLTRHRAALMPTADGLARLGPV